MIRFINEYGLITILKQILSFNQKLFTVQNSQIQSNCWINSLTAYVTLNCAAVKWKIEKNELSKTKPTNTCILFRFLFFIFVSPFTAPQMRITLLRSAIQSIFCCFSMKYRCQGKYHSWGNNGYNSGTRCSNTVGQRTGPIWNGSDNRM